MPSPAAVFARVRERRPFLDHLVRAFGRYSADAGDRLAAAVTFYWFLSLFPILLLAISLLGFVYGDSAQQRVQDALGGVLPPQLVETIGLTLTEAKGPAGVIGLVGTLFSGLGWIEGLRTAIRTVWHQNVLVGNIVVKKLSDILALVGLFATMAASVVVTGAATSATGAVLEQLGVQESLPARAFTRVLVLALAIVADTALFLYLFTRLSRVRSPLSKVLRTALFGAVGFEALKVLGGIYVARTTSSGQATYGTFAVVVGLLLFLNLVSRFLLFTAAWGVTAPYDSDVAPSGTSSPEMARRAGLPEEFADDDPDDPPNLLEEGAPSPLQAAVEGKVPPQDEPSGRGSEREDAPEPAGQRAASQQEGARQGEGAGARQGRDDRPERVEGDRPRQGGGAAGPASTVPAVLPGQGVAVAAARVGIGAGAVLLGGVGVYAVRSLASVFRPRG